jgi:hypothetical protein
MRISGERAIAALQRFLEPSQLAQYDAAIVERLGVIGLDRERRVVSAKRLFGPLERSERYSAPIERRNVARS